MEPRVPRLAVQMREEGYIIPLVVFPGLGCASMIEHGLSERCTDEESLIELELDLIARQAEMPLRFGCGVDAVWYDRFWKGFDSLPFTRVLADGTVTEQVYIGMGHWMTDLGPYRGTRP
jgi:hypothetical protein